LFFWIKLDVVERRGRDPAAVGQDGGTHDAEYAYYEKKAGRETLPFPLIAKLPAG